MPQIHTLPPSRIEDLRILRRTCQHTFRPLCRYFVYELTPKGHCARREQNVDLPSLARLWQPGTASTKVSTKTPLTPCSNLVLQTTHEPWTPAEKWIFCSNKPGLEGGKPAWQLTYERWAAGDTLATIAENMGAKKVKLETVRRHVVEALMHGNPVAIARLADEARWAPPTAKEWCAIDDAAAAQEADPIAPDFRAKPLAAAVAASLAASDDCNAQGAEPADMKRCYESIEWWIALKRIAYPAVFTESTDSNKRQKMS